MSTPLNPGSDDSLFKEKTRWEKALEILDTRRPLLFKRHFFIDKSGKSSPAVTVKREFHPNYQEVVWIKKYLGHLSAFNEHEVLILGHLKYTRHCYHLRGSQQDHLSSFLRVTGKHKDSSAHLITTDKGTTLDQWVEWPVRVGKNPYKHVFCLAGHYLRFALGALRALEELHATNVVHCDLNLGNWCLKTDFDLLRTGPQCLRLKPDWAEISIIDVGYSLHPSTQPQTLLPFETTKVSRYLAAAFNRAESVGLEAFKKLPEYDKTANEWDSFDDAKYTIKFWSSYAPYALREFLTVDWREDYSKLGKVLDEMRGQCGVIHSKNAAVNQLIGEKTPNHEGLAEELTAWGATNSPYDTLTDPTQRMAQAELLRKNTHAALVKKIETAIEKLTPEDDAEYVFIDRSELDDDYRKTLEKKKQLQRRWRTVAPKALCATVSAALLASAAGASYIFGPGLISQFDAMLEVRREKALQSAYSSQTTEQIYKSDWWTAGRRLNLSPSAEQTQWVNNTISNATSKKWPQAQLALGQLYCSGAYPQLVVQSARGCGQWVAAALFGTGFGSLDKDQKKAMELMELEVIDQFDLIVYGRKPGESIGYGAQPGYIDFAQAILPGLVAHQAQFPSLAVRAAHVQACNLQPLQRELAKQTLANIIEKSPDTTVAKTAQDWLNQWHQGNYSSCNTDLNHKE